MVFFPMELLRYKINISKDEIISRLNDNVGPKSFFNLSIHGKLFFGEVYENRFKIMRNSAIQNSFRPIITGNIIENGVENILEILMRPHFIVLIIMIIFLGFSGIVVPIIVFVTGFDTKQIAVSLLAILIALLFLIISVVIFYSIMVLFFKFESRKSRNLLEELFEDKINLIEEEDNIMEIIMYVIKAQR